MAIWKSTLESVDMTPGFWRGKSVFITGHTGFKGSWLSLWLQSLGAKVTGYSVLPHTSPNLFDEGRISESMNSIIGNILSFDTLQEAIKNSEPTIVFHMAAQSLVKYSYTNPVETYSTNVMGTVNLLEAIRNSVGVKCVVNITSDKCYDNREWVWGYRENEALGGLDPYSNSKACSEFVTAAYRSSFFNINRFKDHGVALATARGGNVIGGGDWARDRLVPDIIAAFEKNQVLRIRNPSAVRPWQHVLEALRGYLTLAEKLYEHGPKFGQAWNFGPNDKDSRTVSSIVEEMAQIWGSGAKWENDSIENTQEANFLTLDSSKARNLLKLIPVLELSDSLRLTVEWNKQRIAGSDVRQITLRQIIKYEELIENQIKN